MIAHELFHQDGRRWVYFGRDPDVKTTIIDTNQYLVVDGEDGLLLDPGGLEMFPPFVAALSREIELDKIRLIVSSHQDPDVISSLGLWLGICPDVQVWVPLPWELFIPHLADGRQLRVIPDGGMNVSLGQSSDLRLIPAHYCHSSGNFSTYDPRAKILFSGDIGAAILPRDETSVFVEDFGRHIRHIEGFHRRWMPSNTAKNRWIARVRPLDIAMLCPQHGAIYRGDDVKRFLDWFEQLEVGTAK